MASLVFCCSRMACSSCHASTRLIATASTSSRMPAASRKLWKVDPVWSIFFRFFLGFNSGFFGAWIMYHIRYIRGKSKSAGFRSRAGLKPGPYNFRRRILCMAAALRSYDPRDFSVLYRLDQSGFPAGISYSKTTLRDFLSLRSVDYLAAMEDAHIGGVILAGE